MIFNIQRYSIHDGEGIRTLIFYKGCPLRCRWCSNPESFNAGYSIFYDRRSCKGFGDCLEIGNGAISRNGDDGIRIHRERIQDPFQLNNLCPSKALSLSGEQKSADELMAEIEKDIPFYREDGGVTLSGGEPLSQGAELIEFLIKLKKRGISVNVETSLHVGWDRVVRCTGLVDTFLVDLKHTDPLKFRKFTGGDASLVIDNLRRLVLSREKIIIRIPVIPDFNHTVAEMKKIIDLIDSLGVVKEVHLLPYHTMGIQKYSMLGMDYPFNRYEPVKASEIEPYLRYTRSKKINANAGG